MFKSFLGGIHPHDGKELAKDQPIEAMPVPEQLVVPMSQHIGAPCAPTVKVGEIKTLVRIMLLQQENSMKYSLKDLEEKKVQ